eukprot:TRINITY_DN61805_c0_g1_i1.p1 TRINITY_DN61805_c0_g1~~TRINITY_DN61805_c0_g1_i1.p1  ORF type:complete len:340 (-),score=79.76 TRINITY_DN61805_c0_g1_i1:67-1086(-)
MGCGASNSQKYAGHKESCSGQTHEADEALSGAPPLPAPAHSAVHLRKLRAQLLRNLALEIDEAAAKPCVERQDLEAVVLSQLGAAAANRRAYECRLDVREARELVRILQRLVQEATALASHVEEGKNYVEERLQNELQAAQPSQSHAEVCEQLSAAAGEAGDHLMAVQSVAGDAQSQMDSLSQQLTHSFQDPDGTPLPEFKDLARGVIQMLAMLLPATLGFGTSLAIADTRSANCMEDGSDQNEDESGERTALAYEQQGALADTAQAEREQVLQEAAQWAGRTSSFADLSSVSDAEREALIQAHMARITRTMDVLADEREAQRLRLQRRRANMRARGTT